MKNYPISMLLILLFPVLLPAQLILERPDGKKSVTLNPGSEIILKLPTKTAADRLECECYQSYQGILKKYEADTFTMQIEEYKRIFYEEGGVAKSEQVKYHYDHAPVDSRLLGKSPIAITKIRKSFENLEDAGGVLMLLAAFQGLGAGPLLSHKARRVSDKIVLGGLGVGLTLVLLPNKKTYYLEQPRKGKRKKLWRIRN